MLWKSQRDSDNVEDRRGGGGGRVVIGGGLGTIAIVIIALLLGKNPMQLLNNINGNAPQQTTQQAPGPNDEGRQFVSRVLGTTEDVWREQFRKMGKTYADPTLVLFSGRDQSGCGTATSATGPFYCPADQKIYIDLSFFNELATKFNAAGDFANAYVIAHEVGHHVQNLLGISDKVHELQQRVSEKEANQLSVRLELQADFFAGIWAHYAQDMNKILEPGDLEEALNAASAIGDDKLQMQGQGYVVPDAFTHGTSAQRVAWFKKGFETGDMSLSDTFSGAL
jgi:predicted metalloprotease